MGIVKTGDGHAFYSSTSLGVAGKGKIRIGTLIVCAKCANEVASENAFKRPYRTLAELPPENMDQALQEASDPGIVERCKSLGLAPHLAKQKARELAAEFWSNEEKGTIDILAFWDRDALTDHEALVRLWRTALSNENLVAIKALVAHGAMTNRSLSKHLTALAWACSVCPVEIVAAMIDMGADVNGRSELGKTPLMSAVGSGRVDVVRLLLKKRADVNARSNEGETALGRAEHEGRSGIIEVLRAAGGSAGDRV